MTVEDAAYFAIRAALESPCQSKRGAVIWGKNGVISIGRNHQPQPFPCDGSDICKENCGRTAIHAEQSAILKAAPDVIVGAHMLHVKVVDGKLVASGLPSCMECSKLILESGIAYMWLYHESGWKWYTASEFHRASCEHNLISLPNPRTI